MFKLAAILNIDPGWLHTGKGSMQPTYASELGKLHIERTPLREPEMQLWPFTMISPAQFQALSIDHKRIFESTAAGFVHSCLKQYADTTIKKAHER